MFGKNHKGDLIPIAGITNANFFVESKSNFKLKTGKTYILVKKGLDKFSGKTIIIQNSFYTNNLKVIASRDSFTRRLVQFISLNFAGVYCFRRKLRSKFGRPNRSKYYN